MIHIKHFTSDRDGKNPNWKAAEDWIQNLPRDPNLRLDIISVKAYPTGAQHNLVLVVDDRIAPAKQV